MTIRVAFASSDSKIQQRGQVWYPPIIGGSAWVRGHLPARGINTYDDGGDIEMSCHPGVATNDVTGRLHPLDFHGRIEESVFDIIVLQRWMGKDVPKYIERARAAGQIIIQDVDDLVWRLDPRNRGHAANEAGDEWNPRNYLKSLRASNIVIATNDRLAAEIEAEGCRCIVIPNVIDLRNWQRQPVRDQVETVGWVGMTGWRSGDLETIGDALVKVERKHHIRFIHGGHAPKTHGRDIAEVLQLSPFTHVERRNSVYVEQYPTLWRDIDVAIIPINDVEANTVGKSWIKAMESSAAGVPFVASDLQPYIDYAQGILASDPDSWYSAIMSLIENYDLRQTLADAAYERAQHEDISRRWQDWAQLFFVLMCGQLAEQIVDHMTVEKHSA